MNKKIFLIGFMGSGKSHWGRIWAEREGLIFYDLDTKIESACRMSIANIFEKKSEEKFRKLESYHLRKFEKKKNFILACGGGTPCFYQNMEWMKSNGNVVYLKAKPEILMKYLTGEIEKRPVIKKVNPAELLSFIQQKLKEREPYYLQADVIFDVENLHDDSFSLFLKKIK